MGENVKHTSGLLYDRTGAAFSLDHEIEGTAYVRPMVTVVMQSTNYHGDDFHEEETTEPAGYLVAKDRDELFDAPPHVALDADIEAKKAELAQIKAEAAKVLDNLRREKQKAEWDLASAKRQMDEWMKTHKGMIDLGKLLDGKVLYPLSVEKNHYHGARSIPRIPKMKDIGGLRVEGGDFEKGKEWRAERYLSDTYSTWFQFFDTEEQRASVIQSEFEATCAHFRQKPDFTVDIYTTTNLHYGTLLEWVKTHPALSIPEDIQAMKAANDAELVEKRKAKLAAELAAIDAEARP
ncbi:hypothetical protein MNR02_06395 [Shinella sp. H4-D48]|uniref:hypothetical protein n=1 Tax=Shinella sp. H4-D48 TaxID=2925841 RepID=UPI001F5357C1|nr:hypothetical protein [Shinella sp. H4-D48]UNK39330.1 hypothetical protein MNR02_06395 [Shinella sp. H4-D48]